MPDDPPEGTPPRPLQPADPSDEEVCRYIVETLVELRNLTRRPGLRMLGYMIDNVREEAEKLVKGKGG